MRRDYYYGRGGGSRGGRGGRREDGRDGGSRDTREDRPPRRLGSHCPSAPFSTVTVLFSINCYTNTMTIIYIACMCCVSTEVVGTTGQQVGGTGEVRREGEEEVREEGEGQ